MTRDKKIVQAETIVHELTRQEADEPAYILRDAQITGRLDLKHRTVLVAVDIQGCEFLEEVDLKYCEFTQTVNFSNCTFRKDFNSLEEIGTHTIYRKNLVCDGAVFEEAANFNGSKIEGSASFTEATFGGSADFRWLKCNILSCNGATFRGPANFNTLKCGGSGLFRYAEFQDTRGGVSFAFASFDENFECQESTFHGPASFNTLKCGGSGHFVGARFEGEYRVDFGRTSFDVSLYFDRTTNFRGPANFQGIKCSVLSCDGATFRASANFSIMECRSGFFPNTRFEGEVNFGNASVSGNLECDGASFRGSANFDALRCEGSGYFDGVKFLGEGMVNFSHASFGQDLSCIGSTVRGYTNLNRLKCEGSAWFDRTQFEGDRGVNLSFAYLGSTLRLIDAHFTGPVDLSAARVPQSLTLTDQSSTTRFEREVTLYAATVRVLVLEGNTLPFNEAMLDLREFTFERFFGSEQQAINFAEAQDPTRFTRDPYVQLERYYENVGKDIQARDVHYRGRLALRENATRKGDRVADWSLGRKVSDWFLRVLTGYGVHTGRIVWAIAFLILLGTVVFSLDEVLPVDQALGATPSVAVQESGQSSKSPTPKPTVIDRFAYSVDLFIPVLNLHVEEKWEPIQVWSKIYSYIHVIAGWLLIPLFLASWSGLVRDR